MYVAQKDLTPNLAAARAAKAASDLAQIPLDKRLLASSLISPPRGPSLIIGVFNALAITLANSATFFQ